MLEQRAADHLQQLELDALELAGVDQLLVRLRLRPQLHLPGARELLEVGARGSAPIDLREKTLVEAGV